MRLVVSSEYHFVQTPDGVFADGTYGHAFWRRYLAVFDEVVVITRSQARPAPGRAAVRADGPGVRFCTLPSVRGIGVLAPGSIAAVVQAARAAFDAPAVVLLRAPGVVPFLLTPLLGRARAVGVQIVGDPYESMQSAGRFGRALAPVFARHLGWLARRADATLYVTGTTLQRRYPMAPDKPTYAASDIALPAGLWEQPLPRQSAGPAISLCFMGMLDREYKGLDVLLHALARARHPHTLVIGGDGLLRAQYQALAASLGLGARVTWLGLVPSGGGVHEVMRGCELFVLPSRTEGMPRVLLEAMAVGLPAIATPVGGVPEILLDEAIVPVGDAAALAARLDAWGADRPLRLAQAARNRAAVAGYEQSATEARIRAFWLALRAAAERR